MPAPGRAVTKVVRSPKQTGASRAARMLALASYIERQINAGAIPDYASAACALGVTRARLTQVMNLLLLSPELKTRIVVGKLVLTERALRRVVKEPNWKKQQAIVLQITQEVPSCPTLLST